MSNYTAIQKMLNQFTDSELETIHEYALQMTNLVGYIEGADADYLDYICMSCYFAELITQYTKEVLANQQDLEFDPSEDLCVLIDRLLCFLISAREIETDTLIDAVSEGADWEWTVTCVKNVRNFSTAEAKLNQMIIAINNQ